jgi:hypothetical protein
MSQPDQNVNCIGVNTLVRNVSLRSGLGTPGWTRVEAVYTLQLEAPRLIGMLPSVAGEAC